MFKVCTCFDIDMTLAQDLANNFPLITIVNTFLGGNILLLIMFNGVRFGASWTKLWDKF